MLIGHVCVSTQDQHLELPVDSGLIHELTCFSVPFLWRPFQGRKTSEGKALNITATVAMAIARRAKW